MMTGMTDPSASPPLLPAGPAWLIYGLLVAEGLLWFSERFQWFSFNERKGVYGADRRGDRWRSDNSDAGFGSSRPWSCGGGCSSASGHFWC